MNTQIKKIKSKVRPLLKQEGVVRAGIFGSYARGEQKKGSDVDILVEINDPDMSLLGFIRLKRLVEQLLKKKVDLVEYRALKQRIKDQILREEVRIL